MIIVSGCPRSGTSVMMDCLRHGLGEDRIIGGGPSKKSKNVPELSEHAKQIRNYYIKKQEENKTEAKKKQEKHTQNMNPKGFWECRYTCNGLTWSPEVETFPSNSVMKIVSQGIANTDPKYVDKIIYMLRHPKEVALSQGNLNRGQPFTITDVDPVISVSMFINVTAAAAYWIKNHNPSMIIVNHRNLIQYPEETLSFVEEFLEEGNFKNHPVDSSLYRNRIDQDLNAPMIEESIEIYNAFQKRDWDKVIDIAIQTGPKQKRENGRLFCFRLNRVVSYQECLNCRNNLDVSVNFRNTAQKNGIDWKHEPCTFECGQGLEEDIDGGIKTIEESIKYNHWKKISSFSYKKKNPTTSLVG